MSGSMAGFMLVWKRLGATRLDFVCSILLFAGVAQETVRGQTTLIATGAVWKYLSDGSDQGTGWRQLEFDDSNWPSGEAQLGYGDGDERTVIVSNAPAKPITTY